MGFIATCLYMYVIYLGGCCLVFSSFPFPVLFFLKGFTPSFPSFSFPLLPVTRSSSAVQTSLQSS